MSARRSQATGKWLRRTAGRACAWLFAVWLGGLGGRAATVAAADSDPSAPAEPAMPAAASDTLAGRFAASSRTDWRLDAQADVRHMQTLCADNLRHALQELAAFGQSSAQGAGTGGPDFSLQSLLQGEGATVDLTQPYQAHMDAAEIMPAKRQEADLIGARQFHLLQKFSGGGADPGGTGAQASPRGMRLELNADHAEFGIIATAGTVATGAAREAAATAGPARPILAQMSWPFLVDLQGQVRIQYRNSDAAAAPVTRTGLELRQLNFTAAQSQALLAGDRRAGRALFWSAPAQETTADAPAPAAANTATEAAAKPLDTRAVLLAEFDDGLVMEVRAQRLYVELAWNSASGQTDIRWAGVGQVTIELQRPPAPGLQISNLPGEKPWVRRVWRLAADSGAMLSLPGLPVAAAAAVDADETVFPTSLPTATEPTLLLSLDGQASLRGSIEALPRPDPLKAPTHAFASMDTAVARFNRGLVELAGRTRAQTAGATGAATSAAAPTGDAGILRRVWLTQAGLPPADPAVLAGLPHATEYHQPWSAAALAQAIAPFRLNLPVTSDRVVLVGQPNGQGFENALPANDNLTAQPMALAAQRIFLQAEAGELRGVAAGDPPATVDWRDWQRQARATRVIWQGDSLTLVGERSIATGEAP